MMAGREMTGFAAQKPMDLEVRVRTGAGCGEKSGGSSGAAFRQTGDVCVASLEIYVDQSIEEAPSV